MGQARLVDVHRLLAEDSVDQRMLEILATKAALFDEYVRKSALNEISPDSVRHLGSAHDEASRLRGRGRTENHRDRAAEARARRRGRRPVIPA
jgi:hypothetical protein